MAGYPCILTVAGSDSGGGAGIQADLKAITVLGGFGTSVVTALTAQNGLGVAGIFPAPPEFVRLQIDTVLEGFPVAAAKTGMLFSAPIIEAVADSLARAPFPLVVDPICVSQSGHRLVREDAVQALRERIVPLAALLTPNRPEAELLSGMSLRGAEDIAAAGQCLLGLGARAVLIKGGHFDPDAAGALVDWLCLPGENPRPLRHARVDTPNNHGTGCTLSAAIATFLGLGETLPDAVEHARRYLHRCLRLSYTPGRGAGPVNHLAPFHGRTPDM
jgi:hydroxymethylpyrimidine/phosphomethylpyrimidine kinase